MIGREQLRFTGKMVILWTVWRKCGILALSENANVLAKNGGKEDEALFCL